jgi:hypothetical protein
MTGGTRIGFRSDVTSVLAGAVDARMLGARAARLTEPTPESLARAMQSHGRVVSGDAGVARKCLEVTAVEIHRLNGRPVLRLEGLENAAHACAHGAFDLRVGGACGVEVGGEPFERTVRGGTTAALVDDGVAQDPEEPGNDRLLVAKLAAPLDGLRVRVLQDFLGERARAHALLEEAEESPSVLEEDADRFRSELQIEVSQCRAPFFADAS